MVKKKEKSWPLFKRWSNKAARRPRLALWLSLRLIGRGPIIFSGQRKIPANVFNVHIGHYYALLWFEWGDIPSPKSASALSFLSTFKMSTNLARSGQTDRLFERNRNYRIKTSSNRTKHIKETWSSKRFSPKSITSNQCFRLGLCI